MSTEHRVSFVSHRFESQNIDAIKALFEVIHTQLTQFQQTEPKVTVQSVEELTRRLKELALTVCELSHSVQAIDSLYYLGMIIQYIRHIYNKTNNDTQYLNLKPKNMTSCVIKLNFKTKSKTSKPSPQ